MRGSQLSKSRYDGLGRVTHEFVLGKDVDTDYDDASALHGGDFVLEEHQTTYESESGNVLMRASIARRHHDRSTGIVSTTGPLDTNADDDPLKYTAANIEGRIHISAMWYDGLDRLVDEVHFGTYGAATYDRDGMSVPARSNDALRTSYTYGPDGDVLEVTDPRELVHRTERDDAGRVVATIRNYDSGVNGGAPTGSDQNVTVRYEYENGLRTKLIADLPTGSNDQVTTYTYGTVVGTPTASKVATGHLLSEVAYPDSSSGSDVVSYAYNAQGEEVWRQDQAGNVFESTRDGAGRPTQNRVTTLASGFDGAVRRIETAYDALGRRQTVTQYSQDTGGTVLDQAGFSYDGWGNVASYRQDVDSAFGGSGDDEYEVSYTWAKATGGRASLRRTGITLPSGASVGLDYRSVSGRFDDAVSRVTTLTHGATVAVAYEYLGLGQVVATDYPEPELRWRLYEGNTTGDYTDLDRFGRVVHSRWTKYGELPFGMSPPNIYHVELGYDRNSNIVTAKDHVHAGFDVKYAIDGIDRLTRADEGTLDAGSITDRTRDQQWTLDQVGNWNRDKLDLDGDGFFAGTDEWDDCRTHNDVNELLARDLNCTSPVEHTLAYDAAGNLIDDGDKYKYVYDAFYRLRFIKTQGDDVVSEHRYNGLGHRIAVHVDTDDDGDPDTWEHLAYDERWRLVARYWAGDTDPHEEYLHHQAGIDGHGGSSYIDLVALRDRDTDDNGSLDERIYYCQNWRADVSVLVTDGGKLLEWVKYSAYGVPFGLPAGDADSDGDRDSADRTQIATWASAPSYDVRGDLNLDGVVDSTDETLASGDVEMGRGVLSGVVNSTGFMGRIDDGGNLQWHVRSRVLHSVAGRWFTRDPLGFNDGMSLYESLLSSPVANLDPLGESAVGVAAASRWKCIRKVAKFSAQATACNIAIAACVVSGGVGCVGIAVCCSAAGTFMEILRACKDPDIETPEWLDTALDVCDITEWF